MIAAFLIPMFVYLPGHFLGAYLSRKGDGWAELVLLRVACATAISTPVLVALALLGWFEVPVILGVLGVCAVVTWPSPEGARPEPALRGGTSEPWDSWRLHSRFTLTRPSTS
jgi:hypothetical protein